VVLNLLRVPKLLTLTLSHVNCFNVTERHHRLAMVGWWKARLGGEELRVSGIGHPIMTVIVGAEPEAANEGAARR
jgi:hypothetical protein